MRLELHVFPCRFRGHTKNVCTRVHARLHTSTQNTAATLHTNCTRKTLVHTAECELLENVCTGSNHAHFHTATLQKLARADPPKWPHPVAHLRSQDAGRAVGPRPGNLHRSWRDADGLTATQPRDLGRPHRNALCRLA